MNLVMPCPEGNTKTVQCVLRGREENGMDPDSLCNVRLKAGIPVHIPYSGPAQTKTVCGNIVLAFLVLYVCSFVQ
jgi:hypothetical protein